MSTHDEVTRQSFTKQTALFTGEDAPFAQQRDATLEWLEPLEPAMTMLDVACGGGHVSEAVAPFVRQVVGVDMTPALLALGAERLREAGVANVLLQEGDATALPFVDGSFDLVACRTAVHHFPDPARAVAEMARVCRPGGRVAIVDMVAPTSETRQAFDELHRVIDPSHASCLLEAELVELVHSSVGALSGTETTVPLTVPIAFFLTDAGDPDAAMRALRAELDGGPATGFEPTLDGNEVSVTFTLATVAATHSAA